MKITQFAFFRPKIFSLGNYQFQQKFLSFLITLLPKVSEEKLIEFFTNYKHFFQEFIYNHSQNARTDNQFEFINRILQHNLLILNQPVGETSFQLPHFLEIRAKIRQNQNNLQINKKLLKKRNLIQLDTKQLVEIPSKKNKKIQTNSQKQAKNVSILVEHEKPIFFTIDFTPKQTENTKQENTTKSTNIKAEAPLTNQDIEKLNKIKEALKNLNHTEVTAKVLHFLEEVGNFKKACLYLVRNIPTPESTEEFIADSDLVKIIQFIYENPRISYFQSLEFTSTAILPYILALRQPASRIFLNCLLNSCKLQPKQFIFGLLLPIMKANKLNNFQIEIITRIFKENKDNTFFNFADFFTNLFSTDFHHQWNEFTVQLLSNCLTSVSLDDACLTALLEILCKVSPQFANSIKFSYLLSTLFNKYQAKIKSQQEIFITILSNNKTRIAASLIPKVQASK